MEREILLRVALEEVGMYVAVIVNDEQTVEERLYAMNTVMEESHWDPRWHLTLRAGELRQFPAALRTKYLSDLTGRSTNFRRVGDQNRPTGKRRTWRESGAHFETECEIMMRRVGTDCATYSLRPAHSNVVDAR
jgi:hypothetical protein